MKNEIQIGDLVSCIYLDCYGLVIDKLVDRTVFYLHKIHWFNLRQDLKAGWYSKRNIKKM